MIDSKPSISIKNILHILVVAVTGFVLFLFPLKLGAPYIDEIGFFVPTAIEVFFGSWPALFIAIFALILITIVLVDYLYEAPAMISISLLTVLVILFALICGCSMVWSVNKNSTLIQTVIILAALTGFFAAKRVTHHQPIPYFVFIVIGIAAVFTAVNGVYQFVYGLEEMREMLGFDQFKQIALLYKNDNPQNYALYLRLLSNRIFSTFVYPNSYAGYLCIIIPFIIAPFCMPREMLRKIYFKIVIFSWLILSFWFYMQSQTSFIPFATAAIIFFPLTIVICLFLTGSMGGIITLALITGISLLSIFKHTLTKKRVLLIFSLICCIAFTALLFLPIKNKTRSLDARFQYWQATVQMIQCQPILGFGVGTYGTVYPKYKLPAAEETQFAHNIYLQNFAEIGGAGFLLFFLILAAGVYCFFMSPSHEQKHLHKAAGVSLIAFCIHGMGDFDFSIPCIAFYLFTVLGFIDTSSILLRFKNPLTNTPYKLVAILCVITISIFANSFLTHLVKAQAHLNYAQQLMQDTQYRQQTYSALEEAQELNPLDSKIYFAIAQLYSSDQEWEKSFEHFEQALHRNPYRSSYHYLYAQTLTQSGIESAASKATLEFRKAREYNPTRKEYQLSLPIQEIQ